MRDLKSDQFRPKIIFSSEDNYQCSKLLRVLWALHHQEYFKTLLIFVPQKDTLYFK